MVVLQLMSDGKSRSKFLGWVDFSLFFRGGDQNQNIRAKELVVLGFVIWVWGNYPAFGSRITTSRGGYYWIHQFAVILSFPFVTTQRCQCCFHTLDRWVFDHPVFPSLFWRRKELLVTATVDKSRQLLTSTSRHYVSPLAFVIISIIPRERERDSFMCVILEIEIHVSYKQISLNNLCPSMVCAHTSIYAEMTLLMIQELKFFIHCRYRSCAACFWR